MPERGSSSKHVKIKFISPRDTRVAVPSDPKILSCGVAGRKFPAHEFAERRGMLIAMSLDRAAFYRSTHF